MFSRDEENPASIFSEALTAREREAVERRYQKTREGAVQSHQATPGSVADWVIEIKKVWARGPANTLDLAKVVAVAKARLPYGAWG